MFFHVVVSERSSVKVPENFIVVKVTTVGPAADDNVIPHPPVSDFTSILIKTVPDPNKSSTVVRFQKKLVMFFA